VSNLISCSDLCKAYGGRTLFEGISLSVDVQERVTIIGANGSGKSTLLRILAGLGDADSGECVRRKGLGLGYVSQTPELDPDASVESSVKDSLLAQRERFATDDETDLDVRVRTIITQVGFDDPAQRVGTLSGGWQKRVAIASALVTEPDLLLLDEPTNHLDLEGILWLERLLAESRFAFLVVTHDRAFLQAVSGRVIELDRRYPGGFLSVAGAYSDFLEKRALALETEARRETSLASKVRREIAWLRQGPKARTSKSKGHLERAAKIIDELSEIKSRATVERGAIEFSATGRKSKRLMVGIELAKSMGGRELFAGLDLLLRPKTRLGLVGLNGSGKTTLLRLLADEIAPDAGRLTRLHGVEVVYFDQRREQLDPDQSLRRALSPKGDQVIYQDRELHVISWAKRFLFRADQLDMRVGRLSGGEQAKVLVARLMLRRADILLLDEPTNDLDIPTLEVLEEALTDFPGAVVLITHDRYMLDRVSNVLLGLDGEGAATFFGDYAQWQQTLVTKREPAAKKRSRPWSRRESRLPPRSEPHRARPSRAAPRCPISRSESWLASKPRSPRRRKRSRRRSAESRIRALPPTPPSWRRASEPVRLRRKRSTRSTRDGRRSKPSARQRNKQTAEGAGGASRHAVCFS